MSQRDSPEKLTRRQLFSRLVPPGIKELAGKKPAEDAAEAASVSPGQSSGQSSGQPLGQQGQADQEDHARRVALAREGNVALASGNLDDAVRHFRDYVKQRPDEAPARLSLGRALHAAGQVVQARVEFQRALALCDDGPPHQRDHAILFLGLSFLSLHKPRRAADLWRDWTPALPDPLAAAVREALPGLEGLDEAVESDRVAGCLACVKAVQDALGHSPLAHLPPLVPHMHPAGQLARNG